MFFAFYGRMSMLVFMLTDASIDKDKLMKICLMHDVAEAVVGDITPHDPVTKEEKRRLEEVRAVCCASAPSRSRCHPS